MAALHVRVEIDGQQHELVPDLECEQIMTLALGDVDGVQVVFHGKVCSVLGTAQSHGATEVVERLGVQGQI